MTDPRKKNRGWDIVTRGTHWVVAGLFLTNYFYTEPGYRAHMNIGWIILGLVIFRIIWGVSFARGPNRITNFLPTPRGVKEHVVELKTRQAAEPVGHNAFGSFAIFLMWFGLLSAVFTGWLQDTDWGFDNDVYEWHEFLVEALWILVIIHISAVILTSLWLRRNLIKQMLNGK
ncbi:MAG: cytochrome b/b6 domain-containing protein [Acidiferrobacterales bacterium]|nr:cytochrome b/b6 domain-containing protein [Acidiferrobacterales bacterium]